MLTGLLEAGNIIGSLFSISTNTENDSSDNETPQINPENSPEKSKNSKPLRLFQKSASVENISTDSGISTLSSNSILISKYNFPSSHLVVQSEPCLAYLDAAGSITTQGNLFPSKSELLASSLDLYAVSSSQESGVSFYTVQKSCYNWVAKSFEVKR